MARNKKGNIAGNDPFYKNFANAGPAVNAAKGGGFTFDGKSAADYAAAGKFPKGSKFKYYGSAKPTPKPPIKPPVGNKPGVPNKPITNPGGGNLDKYKPIGPGGNPMPRGGGAGNNGGGNAVGWDGTMTTDQGLYSKLPRPDIGYSPNDGGFSGSFNPKPFNPVVNKGPDPLGPKTTGVPGTGSGIYKPTAPIGGSVGGSPISRPGSPGGGPNSPVGVPGTPPSSGGGAGGNIPSAPVGGGPIRPMPRGGMKGGGLARKGVGQALAKGGLVRGAGKAMKGVKKARYC